MQNSELYITQAVFESLLQNTGLTQQSRTELANLLNDKNFFVQERTQFLNKVIRKIYKNKKIDSQIYKKLFLAYEFSRLKHLKQRRKDGSLYFGHPFTVANILLDEYRSSNIDGIILSLLHDVWEDVLRNYIGDKDSYELLKTIFGEPIAFAVDLMTKDIRTIEFTSKEHEKTFREERDIRYFDRLNDQLKTYKKLSQRKRKILLVVIRVKCADRIHNLRETKNLNEEFIKRKIEETKKYLLPLAEKWDRESYFILNNEIKNLESNSKK